MDYNYIQHHGVKGMKWGVRKAEVRAARGKRKSVDQKAAELNKKIDVRERGTLSDADLQKRVNRLQMEKQLRTLTNEELHRGRSLVTGVLTDIGKQVITRIATTALTGAALYGMKAAVSKSFDAGDFATAIFQGGAKKK